MTQKKNDLFTTILILFGIILLFVYLILNNFNILALVIFSVVAVAFSATYYITSKEIKRKKKIIKTVEMLQPINRPREILPSHDYTSPENFPASYYYNYNESEEKPTKIKVRDLIDNQKFLNDFESEKDLNNFKVPEDFKVNIISFDLWEKIDSLDLEETEKEDFINQILQFKPSELQIIVERMLKLKSSTSDLLREEPIDTLTFDQPTSEVVSDKYSVENEQENIEILDIEKEIYKIESQLKTTSMPISEKDLDVKLFEPIPADIEIDKLKEIKSAKNLVDNSKILNLVKELNNIEELSSSKDFDITTILDEIWKEIDDLDLKENDKEEIIEYIVSLVPKERQELINSMLKLKLQKKD